MKSLLGWTIFCSPNHKQFFGLTGRMTSFSLTNCLSTTKAQSIGSPGSELPARGLVSYLRSKRNHLHSDHGFLSGKIGAWTFWKTSSYRLNQTIKYQHDSYNHRGRHTFPRLFHNEGVRLASILQSVEPKDRTDFVNSGLTTKRSISARPLLNLQLNRWCSDFRSNSIICQFDEFRLFPVAGPLPLMFQNW